MRFFCQLHDLKFCGFSHHADRATCPQHIHTEHWRRGLQQRVAVVFRAVLCDNRVDVQLRRRLHKEHRMSLAAAKVKIARGGSASVNNGHRTSCGSIQLHTAIVIVTRVLHCFF
jgi:hypothetical protein